ncbi:Immunoglobulin subtype,Immunoglobulin-like domain,Immunoglobulin-like fold,Immunoglobulin subtype 2 [Cinara cedri]|uniref:Immunoglobulin subtype,Immunoglobulin-like domain,Immunoglobulin-like fold,Immunoglobulin subtype 2 n=1 Tax=Cinara cedri TaxID=506608 RepID=A0A5E4MQZ6_9HEMI|nr:Immunoglobulin subtype,Immunoglobulin-like domain,Immunoglobulin-like fold,Immunoglobulin subtype 2 [Cinara cedri]
MSGGETPWRLPVVAVGCGKMVASDHYDLLHRVHYTAYRLPSLTLNKRSIQINNNMGHSAVALLGFSWLFFINTIGFASVLPLNHITENSLDESSSRGSEQSTAKLEYKDWVMVKTSSDKIIVSPGGRVELECTVFGSPVPEAKWISGIKLNQITVTTDEFEELRDFQGVGKVTVRKVIDCIQPHHKNVYTCVGQARDQTMSSNPVTISVEGEAVQCSQGKTRITKWSPIITQLMGSTVMIPCQVVNSAPYRKYWKDNFGNIIDTDTDPRRKLGPEGELVLNNLSWSDMGEYVCVVENSISRDETSTFLYPMLSNA